MWENNEYKMKFNEGNVMEYEKIMLSSVNVNIFSLWYSSVRSLNRSYITTAAASCR